MAFTSTYETICRQQKAWATRREITFDEHGYVFSITDNLFLPLLPQVANMLSKGSGNEIGIGESRGKLFALHSSAALVLNVFQYWFNRDVGSIAEACGAPEGMKEMHFERTHPTRLGGIPPHIDVEFCSRGLRPLAIESKYTETYHFHDKRQIRDRYLTRRELWDGLPRCRELVQRIHDEQEGQTSFAHLDVPQLLKHLLGLTRAYPRGFELLYLWYDYLSPEAEKHRTELGEFKKCLHNEVNFRDMTYQELFEALRTLLGSEPSYIDYLSERYFGVEQ